jgi:hypothetical protein
MRPMYYLMTLIMLIATQSLCQLKKASPQKPKGAIVSGSTLSEAEISMVEEMAVIKENTNSDLTPYELAEIGKKLAEIKASKTSKPEIVNDWAMEVININSSNTTNFKAVLGFFGINYTSNSNYSYCLIQMFKTSEPEIFINVLKNPNRNMNIIRGYGAIACIEIQSSNQVVDASGLETLSAKVQLNNFKAAIKILPIGIVGPKISAKFSELVGDFNVKTIVNLYRTFDKMQQFESDSTTKLTPQILKAQVTGKGSIFLPDRPN